MTFKISNSLQMIMTKLSINLLWKINFQEGAEVYSLTNNKKKEDDSVNNCEFLRALNLYCLMALY